MSKFNELYDAYEDNIPSGTMNHFEQSKQRSKRGGLNIFWMGIIFFFMILPASCLMGQQKADYLVLDGGVPGYYLLYLKADQAADINDDYGYIDMYLGGNEVWNFEDEVMRELTEEYPEVEDEVWSYYSILWMDTSQMEQLRDRGMNSFSIHNINKNLSEQERREFKRDVRRALQGLFD